LNPPPTQFQIGKPFRQGKEIMQQLIQHDVPRFEHSLAVAEGTAEGLIERRAAPHLQTCHVPRAAEAAQRAAKKAVRARKHYAEHRSEETARTKGYKQLHPQLKRAMDSLRNARIAAQSNGTASPAAIKRMKSAATSCAYCGGGLFRKQTDHIITLALGGEHSLRNIVIVCPDCNQRKHALSYEQWIDRVEPCHRARVIAVFESRYGLQDIERVAA
jgi:5-methylcytosine-specific restriction endonuclease McrA